MDKLASTIAKAPEGATVVLLYEGAYDYSIKESFSIPEGQTLYFDLNGRTLVHSSKSTDNYDGGLFKVQEGSIFNLYSSKPNGMIFESAKPNSTLTFSTAGVVSVPKGVDECQVYIGDRVDKDGKTVLDCGDNLSLNGGSIVRVNGLETAEENNKIINDNKIKIYINGGFYYSPLRASYAAIVTLAPDVVVNIRDASFYVNCNTYAVFHDYQDTDTADYASTMDISAYNTSFIIGSPTGRIYYSMSASSSVYYEDCNIIAHDPHPFAQQLIRNPNHDIQRSARIIPKVYNQRSVFPSFQVFHCLFKFLRAVSAEHAYGNISCVFPE